MLANKRLTRLSIENKNLFPTWNTFLKNTLPLSGLWWMYTKACNPEQLARFTVTSVHLAIFSSVDDLCSIGLNQVVHIILFFMCSVSRQSHRTNGAGQLQLLERQYEQRFGRHLSEQVKHFHLSSTTLLFSVFSFYHSGTRARFITGKNHCFSGADETVNQLEWS